MKRLHCYCDVCGKDMTYIDCDEETCLQGLFMIEPIRVEIEIKTNYGSKSSQVGVGLSDFCSYDCFKKTIEDMLERISSGCATMQPLTLEGE